jgi:hypothetical protein
MVSVQRNDTSSINCNPGPQITPHCSTGIPSPPNEPTAVPYASQMHQCYRPVNVQPSYSLPPCPPPLQPPVCPPFPNPGPNTFLLYSLRLCHPLTCGCFGCGKTLKPSGVIGEPPGDLVIVSFMPRQFRHEGELHSKEGNVYFHCMTTCVRSRQPAFDPRMHCTVPNEIRAILTPTHIQYLQQNLGLFL